MVKVSIVMPVLNGMPYFKEAIESVRNQSFGDIEIIVVDAGSSDGTYEFVEELKRMDERIVLFHSPKKSMGMQYNIGIKQARGEYIGFCESDDEMEKNAIIKMFELAQKNNYPDVVKGAFTFFVDSKNKHYTYYNVMPKQSWHLLNQVISAQDEMELFIRDNTMWNGIYKRSFIDENCIMLNETNGAAFQDTGFVNQVLMKAKSMVYSDFNVYFYRKDNIGSSVYKSTAGLFAINEFEYILSLVRDDCELRQRYLYHLLQRMFSLVCYFYGKEQVLGSAKQYKDKFEALHNFWCNYYELLNDIEKDKIKGNGELRILKRSKDDFGVCVKNTYLNRMEMLLEFWDTIRGENAVVLFGAGEWGRFLASTIINNGYNGELIYCDNSFSIADMIEDLKVINVADAVKEYKNAVYVVTNLQYWNAMSAQLNELGIDSDRIIRTPYVGAHECLELNFDYIREIISRE